MNDLYSYLLYFIHEYGNTEDFLKIYEDNYESLEFRTHLAAIKEYIRMGDIKKIEESIIRATQYWYPMEHNQVEPIVFLTDEMIRPFITNEIANQILLTPKLQ
ncbi:MAG: hypothetical protein EOP53_23870 [Sphingobacteriales bacterium]|nr:MAG: hypothetical protein EOP53_23870 [Sphingobacteriales bacterium]